MADEAAALLLNGTLDERIEALRRLYESERVRTREESPRFFTSSASRRFWAEQLALMLQVIDAREAADIAYERMGEALETYKRAEGAFPTHLEQVYRTRRAEAEQKAVEAREHLITLRPD